MKLNEQPHLPQGPADDWNRRLVLRLYELLSQIARKVNAMASGTAAGFDGGGTAAPTTGTWSQGDTWRNTAPAELGAAGSKYVLTGWVCVAGGTPGTWREQRTLTGN